MDYTTLGRTGLRVSVMGLGCGGHSRLGMARGGTEEEAAEIVRRALDLGVNFIDTAEGYGTEGAVSKGLAGRNRAAIVLSTKSSPRAKDALKSAADIRASVEGNLSRLGTDTIDVFHLHGVRADDYDHCVAELVPAFRALRQEGKIRFLGITEAFGGDTKHRTLARAVRDDCWDVMMVGFNLLNPSARDSVLVHTQAKRIGTLDMFAVRRALSDPDALKELMQGLVQQGLVEADAFDADDPLGFLLEDGAAESIPDAAYRFCRHEPGIDVVLSGTGNVAHLEENAASLLRPPLPESVAARLRALFARVDTVSGN